MLSWNSMTHAWGIRKRRTYMRKETLKNWWRFWKVEQERKKQRKGRSGGILKSVFIFLWWKPTKLIHQSLITTSSSIVFFYFLISYSISLKVKPHKPFLYYICISVLYTWLLTVLHVLSYRAGVKGVQDGLPHRVSKILGLNYN